jgi:hypothetical protein
MFKSLFYGEPEDTPHVLEIRSDPRPGIQAPPPNLVAEWLEHDAEVIDLGAPHRDQAILPTTWHR